MKIGLIADIHGNLAALQAVLAALAEEQPAAIVCLGDVAATGPQPHETLALLWRSGCPTVMGNADAFLLRPEAAAPEAGEDARRIAEIDAWCADRLTAADRAFVATFQPTVEIPLGGGRRLLCCHGSPRSFDDAIAAETPDSDLDRMLGGQEATLVACGHTHARLLRRHRASEIVNPGSVGLAYRFLPDGAVRVPPWAEFALVDAADGGPLGVTFHRVPYDQAATDRAMTEHGMPHAAWRASDWG
jgi:predicted phosphodiesterase